MAKYTVLRLLKLRMVKYLSNLEEIDNGIRAIRDMLQVWETDELKRYLCEALELRSLILLNQNKESETNDILN